MTILEALIALRAYAGRAGDLKTVADITEVLDNRGDPRERGWCLDRLILAFPRLTYLVDLRDHGATFRDPVRGEPWDPKEEE